MTFLLNTPGRELSFHNCFRIPSELGLLEIEAEESTDNSDISIEFGKLYFEISDDEKAAEAPC